MLVILIPAFLHSKLQFTTKTYVNELAYIFVIVMAGYFVMPGTNSIQFINRKLQRTFLDDTNKKGTWTVVMSCVAQME